MEYAVIGLGRFGLTVAQTLTDLNQDVIAIEIDEQKAKEVSEIVRSTLILDATDVKALTEISIEHVDVVIVGMGQSSMTQSILTCLALKKVGVKMIIAKAVNESHKEILEKIGVDRVINPEEAVGKKIAKQLVTHQPFDGIALSDTMEIRSLLVTKNNTKVVFKTIQEVNLRKHFNINIVCIKRAENEVIIAEHDTMIMPGDILLIAGEIAKIDLFEKKYGIGK